MLTFYIYPSPPNQLNVFSRCLASCSSVRFIGHAHACSGAESYEKVLS